MSYISHKSHAKFLESRTMSQINAAGCDLMMCLKNRQGWFMLNSYKKKIFTGDSERVNRLLIKMYLAGFLSVLFDS